MNISITLFNIMVLISTTGVKFSHKCFLSQNNYSRTWGAAGGKDKLIAVSVGGTGGQDKLITVSGEKKRRAGQAHDCEQGRKDAAP